jgi:hypothetical protein
MTKDQAAEALIERHFEIEPGLVQVFRILADSEEGVGEPIKLLEVNRDTVSTGEVEAFMFSRSADVPFNTVIAEVTEADLALIQAGALKLPSGWSLSRSKTFTRPSPRHVS